MLVNKFMKANYLLWGMSNSYSRQEEYGMGNVTRNANCSPQDKYEPYTVTSSQLANKIRFYSEQPILADTLFSVANPPLTETVATSLVNGTTYNIVDLGDTDFTEVGAGWVDVTTTTASTDYVIKEVGDTDFTLIGAADNNVGTTFTATGAGTGTGRVLPTSHVVAVGDSFTATGAGTGTGRVNQLPNNALELLSFNLQATFPSMSNGSTNIPEITYTSTDDNQTPINAGTAKWFVLFRNDDVVIMGEVSDLNGTGDIKLSNTTMDTNDSYRFYSLTFGISNETIFTDANTVLVTA